MRVDRHVAGPCLQNPQQRRDHFGRPSRPHADEIAAPDPGGAQALCHPGRLRRQLPVGQRPALPPQRRRRRCGRRHLGEQLRNRSPRRRRLEDAAPLDRDLLPLGNVEKLER